MLNESILQKIQKLKALAERPGTLAEAENAMARIQELLHKYNLEMADVDNYVPATKDDVIQDKHDLNEYQNYHDGNSAYRLVGVIAHFNFCQVIGHRINVTSKTDQGKFSVIGQRHNVEAVIYMFHYCLNNMKTLADEGWKVYDKSHTKIKNVYRRHFYTGATDALCDRLRREEVKQKVDAKFGAMVLVNSKAVELKVAELFPRLGTAKAFNNFESDITAEGYAAGQKMNLNKGLSDSDSSAKQLR